MCRQKMHPFALGCKSLKGGYQALAGGCKSWNGTRFVRICRISYDDLKNMSGRPWVVVAAANPLAVTTRRLPSLMVSAWKQPSAFLLSQYMFCILGMNVDGESKWPSLKLRQVGFCFGSLNLPLTQPFSCCSSVTFFMLQCSSLNWLMQTRNPLSASQSSKQQVSFQPRNLHIDPEQPEVQCRIVRDCASHAPWRTVRWKIGARYLGSERSLQQLRKAHEKAMWKAKSPQT